MVDFYSTICDKTFNNINDFYNCQDSISYEKEDILEGKDLVILLFYKTHAVKKHLWHHWKVWMSAENILENGRKLVIICILGNVSLQEI